jgi:hypothetical protein
MHEQEPKKGETLVFPFQDIVAEYNNRLYFIEQDVEKFEAECAKHMNIFGKNTDTTSIEKYATDLQKSVKGFTSALEQEVVKRQAGILLNNIKNSTLSRLEPLVKRFQSKQIELFKVIQSRKNTNYGVPSSDPSFEEIMELKRQEFIERNMTEQQLNDVMYNFEDLQIRDQELKEILGQVQQTHMLMMMIQKMIVEQGTALDRIDRSLEEDSEYLDKAVYHLKSAEKKACCSRITLCLFFIFFTLILVFLAVGGKFLYLYGPTIIKWIIILIPK